MIDIRIATALVIALGSACFACFTWGTIKHFVWEGKGSKGAWVVSMSSWAGFLAFLWVALTRPLGAFWPAAIVVFVLSGSLWYWALIQTRRSPPTLAFTQDTPRFLFDGGPYRWVRHPFYSAYMLFWIGAWLADGSIVSLVIAGVIGVMYLVAARHEEEKFARSDFAPSYMGYAARTGMFMPRVWTTSRTIPSAREIEIEQR